MPVFYGFSRPPHVDLRDIFYPKAICQYFTLIRGYAHYKIRANRSLGMPHTSDTRLDLVVMDSFEPKSTTRASGTYQRKVATCFAYIKVGQGAIVTFG